MESVIYRDLGTMDYAEALAVQRECFDALSSGGGEQCLLMCEHPHVYTLGRNANAANMLVDEGFLKKINASCHRTDRGGDITYHGPGQIVAYPILDLGKLGLGLKEYIHALEEAVIGMLGDYDIAAGRDAGATGVWLEGPKRKICAIGVRASRYVTMHGLALNVNTDLGYFAWINPCGFTDRGVTSMERELRAPQDMERAKGLLAARIAEIMNIKIIKKHGSSKEMGHQATGRPGAGSRVGP